MLNKHLWNFSFSLWMDEREQKRKRERERERERRRKESPPFFLLRIRDNRKSTATVGRAGFNAFWWSYLASLFVAFSLSFSLIFPGPSPLCAVMVLMSLRCSRLGRSSRTSAPIMQTRTHPDENSFRRFRTRDRTLIWNSIGPPARRREKIAMERIYGAQNAAACRVTIS